MNEPSGDNFVILLIISWEYSRVAYLQFQMLFRGRAVNNRIRGILRCAVRSALLQVLILLFILTQLVEENIFRLKELK